MLIVSVDFTTVTESLSIWSYNQFIKVDFLAMKKRWLYTVVAFRLGQVINRYDFSGHRIPTLRCHVKGLWPQSLIDTLKAWDLSFWLMCWNAINIHWNNLKNDHSLFALHIRSYMHSHVLSYQFFDIINLVFFFIHFNLIRDFFLFMIRSLFLFISIWFGKVRSFEKKFLFQNFVFCLILHAKFLIEQKFRICRRRFRPKFHNWNRSNSISEIWWFMKNVEPSSISVLSWFDDFFRSIHFDALTLMIFVLMRRFRASQGFFLIITSAGLFFSSIHLISIISRLS